MEGFPDSNVLAEAENLIRFLDICISERASQDERAKAYTFCERFKEESEMCAAVGFYLASAGHCSPQTKHFGLQLIEHCIKFRLTKMSTEEKESIKEFVWRYITTLSDVSTQSKEPVYIKEGAVKLVVEMVKQLWPQEWKTFQDDLFKLSTGTEMQIEMVLLILLRLAEDVGVFQSVADDVRRKQLYDLLRTRMMDEIIPFLMRLLDVQLSSFRQSVVNINEESAQVHCRLAKAVLVVFYALVEWISIDQIMVRDGHLLVQLCLLLSDENLRLAACECLLQIAGRKGPAKERKPLLILFSQGVITLMLEAAELAAQQPIDESNYSFLKCFSQVLVQLGLQLCRLYGKEPDVVKPDAFPLFLQTLLSLGRHPSLRINHVCVALWSGLFGHDLLKSDPHLLGNIEAFLEVAKDKLIPPGYYSRLDFESDEDLIAFHLKFKAELLAAVRLACTLCPQESFNSAQQWFLSQLSDQTGRPLAEWKALALFLDAVCSRVRLNPHGPALLERCIALQTDDPAMLSQYLRCISALFIYVHLDVPKLLTPVLDWIFSAVLFLPPNQTKENCSQTVRNVRHQACSLLVHICSQFPMVLVQRFDYLKSGIERLNVVQLTKMECCILQEALLVISNELGHSQLQIEFVNQLIRPAIELWTAMNPFFKSTREFMNFIGLNRPPVNWSEEDQCARNRTELTICSCLFLAIAKRCKVLGSSQHSVHPAAGQLTSLSYNLFLLAKVLHQAWYPSARAMLSPVYAAAYDLLKSEMFDILTRAQLSHLYYPSRQQQQGPLERMQEFLTQLHSTVMAVLGSLGEAGGIQFYTQSGLALAAAGTACSGIEHFPDARLRIVIRSFCRPFIQSCPPHLYGQVLAPFFAHLFPAMLQHLSSKWRQLDTEQQSQAACSDDDRTEDLKKVVQGVAVRLLTLDYLDLLRYILLNINKNRDGTSQVPSVSELGKAVLGDISVCGNLVQCLISALWWPDSSNSVKAANILLPVVKYWATLTGTPRFPSVKMPTVCLVHLLNGLRLLGQNDVNLSSLVNLGVAIYDTFLPYPNYSDDISKILIEYAGALRKDIADYKVKQLNLLNGCNKPNPKVEMEKREIFRTMTRQVVGQPLSDLFRKPVHLAIVPKLRSLKPLLTKPDVVEEADLSKLFIQD